MSSVKKQQEIIEILQSVCEELGWVIGIPADDDETLVDGLIIGKEEFVYAVVDSFGQEYDVFSKNFGDEGMTELEKSVPAKKKQTFH